LLWTKGKFIFILFLRAGRFHRKTKVSKCWRKWDGKKDSLWERIVKELWSQ
jgi:hypothetical protein